MILGSVFEATALEAKVLEAIALGLEATAVEATTLEVVTFEADALGSLLACEVGAVLASALALALSPM